MAALKALSVAHELGFQNSVLEGDALNLIQALKAQEQNLLPWGLLVEDVKEYGKNLEEYRILMLREMAIV